VSIATRRCNSTRRRVELSCVAINGPLVYYTESSIKFNKKTNLK